ncbi:MAG: peroxiredoxin family protein [Patescibacteria group bacterium]
MNKTIIGIIIGTVALLGILLWLGTRAQQSTSPNAQITVGTPAPEFRLPSTHGGTVSLADFKGKKNVLLYFHEGITCDPCWEQIPAIEKHLKDLEAMNVTHLNVTTDPLEDIKKRAAPYGITTPTLEDINNKVTKAYDMERFSMAMPSSSGIRPGHSFVLIGIDGIIRWRKDYWDGYGMMNVPGGKMYVEPIEIINNVKAALAAN